MLINMSQPAVWTFSGWANLTTNSMMESGEDYFIKPQDITWPLMI